MSKTPWKAFLPPNFCELHRGLQAEERTDYYSLLELVSMNNLRVISVKEQMSKTNWQPFFQQSMVHFQKVSSVVFLNKFWNLHFPFYVSHRLRENTFLVSVKGTVLVVTDNPQVYYSLGGTMRRQTFSFSLWQGSELSEHHTVFARCKAHLRWRLCTGDVQAGQKLAETDSYGVRQGQDPGSQGHK